MKDKILRALYNIEQEHNIKILLSVEAGSRAWGFESKDSNYDVRFIYLNRPEWYLSISEKPRDVIEHVYKETDLDIVGWELRKTLRLLKKSNPTLLEWMNSDIIYMQRGWFTHDLCKAAEDFYSPRPLLYHYLHMARGNIREYLKDENEVWLKKYLYVIRPLLVCKWIEMYETMPPINFEKLYNGVLNKCCIISVGLVKDIDSLVLRKKQGDELSFGPIIPSIHDFIRIEVDRLTAEEKSGGKNWPTSVSPKSFDALNNLLRKALDNIEIF